ncbi:MAG: zinc ABC transporter substrate-binding protein [Magnetococcales bacterium]|nr:zinc ABC transporter substrate-binding protein [Magnetococcales bacterium]
MTLQSGLLAVWFLFLAIFPLEGWAGPRVVVSIKPIHSLVAGVMKGTGEPDLLLPGIASPHAHALRPSEAALLRHADVVFWIGRDLETFLVKPLAQLATNAKVVALHQTPGLVLLPNRETVERLATDETPAVDGNHHPGTSDMHLWLDPVNAVAMVRWIAQTLEEIDPPMAARYRDNALGLEKRIERSTADFQKRLSHVQGKPFLVFHDAYHYFENRFGLTCAGFISINPERPISAHRLKEIHTRIVQSGSRCIFAEPQFEPAIIDTLLANHAIRKGTLDPLGSDGPMGEEGWFVLMEQLVTRLSECLDRP